MMPVKSATVIREDKIDSYIGISCYADEKERYAKLFKKRSESLSQSLRRILNEAADKLEPTKL